MQVGDVLLVEDESVVEKEINLVGLETLVGYSVVTPAGQKIGKVRGYSFNVDSGGVESLELDSFGMSILPSSLVSTYALFTEDVLEVGSDTVVIHEDAVSSIQRLTKGLWGNQRAGNSTDETDDYPGFSRERTQSSSSLRRNKNISSKKLRQKVTEAIDKWELPMDYL
ncbi:hypothetical protein Leryth_024094 [Lithospermum erythrorhizon]|nr:hypothetical protein Leryth_024094 [Lithospermum erythrorhizon]